MDPRHTTSLSKAFKALGHPTRLGLIDVLRQGPACVNDLNAAVGFDMSTISKHLSVLRTAGLVQDRRQGNQVFYSLTCECLGGFLDCMGQVLAQDGGIPGSRLELIYPGVTASDASPCEAERAVPGCSTQGTDQL